MQVRWLIDGEGPSPSFENDGLSVRIPAGTVMGVGAAIGDADCWILCFPDNSGDYARGVPGLISCEPADAECREKFDREWRKLSPSARRWFDMARKRTEVVRREQIAKASVDEKAGIQAMPVHPDLVPSEREPVVLDS